MIGVQEEARGHTEDGREGRGDMSEAEEEEEEEEEEEWTPADVEEVEVEAEEARVAGGRDGLEGPREEGERAAVRNMQELAAALRERSLMFDPKVDVLLEQRERLREARAVTQGPGQAQAEAEAEMETLDARARCAGCGSCPPWPAL
jgi:hypothetical protein